MTSLLRASMQACVAPKHQLSIPRTLWANGVSELHRRSQEHHESGAFLLGRISGQRRTTEQFVYYEDLEPYCLDSGVVVFEGSGFDSLWRLCRDSGLTVVADIHTHPGIARQSSDDRDNPMIALAGHIALIIPSYAKGPVALDRIAVYVYEGAHCWRSYLGTAAKQFLYVGRWA